MSLSNKVVIVTGGSSGIGASTAILFSQQGANVIIVGRNETKLHNVAGKCAQKPFIIKADLANENDVKRIIEETVEKFGKIDVLVNNAGILRHKGIEDENVLQTYDEIMATNLRAVIHITNLAVPYLIKTKGNIVNISSIAAETIHLSAGFLLYSVSKAALNHFSKIIASDLASKGVRVNLVSPGPVRTDVLTNANDDTPWEFFNTYTGLGRISEPEEIAELVVYLASDKGKCVTGANFVADNGMLVKKSS